MKTFRALLILLVLFALPSCKLKKDAPKPAAETAMTAEEALAAIDEAAIASDAESLMAGAVEIATTFTIGQAVEAAASEIQDFIASQLPCAEIVIEGPTLAITYGAQGGNCTYRGRTWSGSHSITVSQNESDDVLVQHAWVGLSDGRVSVTGTADVTWSLSAQSRHIEHELTWTRLSDGRVGVGSGDRTQKALDGGVSEGIIVDGSRAWEGEAGRWDLAIEDVEMRWVDPVPQAGAYQLASPSGRSIRMTFERVDEDTIEVTLTSGDRSFSFHVTKLGGIEGA